MWEWGAVKGRLTFSEVMQVWYSDKDRDWNPELARRGREAEEEVKSGILAGEVPAEIRHLVLDRVSFGRGNRLKGYDASGILLTATPDVIFLDPRVKVAHAIEEKMRSAPRGYDLIQALFVFVAGSGDATLREFGFDYSLYYLGSQTVETLTYPRVEGARGDFTTLCLSAVGLLGMQTTVDNQRREKRASKKRPHQGSMWEARVEGESASLSLTSGNRVDFDLAFENLVRLGRVILDTGFH